MVVQQFIKLENKLQVSNLGNVLVTQVIVSHIEKTLSFKKSMMYSCSG